MEKKNKKQIYREIRGINNKIHSYSMDLLNNFMFYEDKQTNEEIQLTEIEIKQNVELLLKCLDYLKQIMDGNEI